MCNDSTSAPEEKYVEGSGRDIFYVTTSRQLLREILTKPN
jgi:hypothetical protein